MKILSELKNAIAELEEQKNAMLSHIEKSGWKDNRGRKKIPEKRLPIEINEFFTAKVIPAKAPLPKNIGAEYQRWYSAARIILARNQPDRLEEFDQAYFKERTFESGIKELCLKKHVTKEQQLNLMDLIAEQWDILAAVPSHLEFSIYDVELTAYSILMDDELVAARHLLSKGFHRAAGALAGVVLERHLKNLLTKVVPPVKFRKNITLSPLNDLCKENIYDMVTWRKVQYLIELRNLCDHDKKRPPKAEEVDILIDGVAAVLKNQNI
ncbi:MAG: hypothetical protein ACYC6O_08275 [Thermoleophilia bacterium]